MESVLIHAVHVIVGILLAALWQKFHKHKMEQDAIKMGLQSLLRSEITKAYYKYMEKGWIPIYALESLESVYKNYKALGQDGVMGGLWEELIALPHTQPKNEKEVK